MIGLFQTVELIKALPGYAVKKGDRGVVVAIFDTPSIAYEVEFVDHNGQTIECIALTGDFLKVCLMPGDCADSN